MAKRLDNGSDRPTHEEITRRAKAIYEASGQVPGRDLENWLAAEAELMNAHKPVPESRPVAEARALLKDMSKDSLRR